MAEVAAATEKLEKELEECQSLRLAHANLRGRNRALTTRVAKLEEEVCLSKKRALLDRVVAQPAVFSCCFFHATCMCHSLTDGTYFSFC